MSFLIKISRVRLLPKIRVMRLSFMLCTLLLSSACSSLPGVPIQPVNVTSTATAGITSSNPIPVFAYYYIWFDPTSWDKDKIDYPLLGHYSSDDPAVMRQHIEWAKGAGIKAFIVSWKSTDKLDPRLEQLIEIAKEEDFKLAINYEGLDEQRNPLPITQIAARFRLFYCPLRRPVGI